METFKAHFNLETLPSETLHLYHTVGGFVVTYLGRIPTAGEAFVWNGWRVEVVDMDGNRVDKVLVMRLADQPQAEAQER